MSTEFRVFARTPRPFSTLEEARDFVSTLDGPTVIFNHDTPLEASRPTHENNKLIRTSFRPCKPPSISPRSLLLCQQPETSGALYPTKGFQLSDLPLLTGTMIHILQNHHHFDGGPETETLLTQLQSLEEPINAAIEEIETNIQFRHDREDHDQY